MIPAVPAPQSAKIKRPVELTLKPGWRFEPRQRAFISRSGKRFTPAGDLPKHSRIVPKVPLRAKAGRASPSKHEEKLRRYVQVVLPARESPDAYLDAIRAWPGVAAAHVAPAISLPSSARAAR